MGPLVLCMIYLCCDLFRNPNDEVDQFHNLNVAFGAVEEEIDC